MKRALGLIVLLSVLLSGCSGLGERIKDPVTFHYIRQDFQKDMGIVLDSEVREASGHRDDLPYLLVLYSMGPSQKDLASPLPRGTRITVTENEQQKIVLSLSENAYEISDAELTLAGACLSLTCMELTEAKQVTVICNDRSVTIGQENLLLDGGYIQIQAEETK